MCCTNLVRRREDPGHGMPLEKGCWVSVPETLRGNGAGTLCFSGHMRPGWAWGESRPRTIVPALSCFAPTSSSRAQGTSRMGLALPRTVHPLLPLSAPQPVHSQLVREPSSACLCPDEGWTSLMATLYAQSSEEISVEKLLGRGGALGPVGLSLHTF